MEQKLVFSEKRSRPELPSGMREKTRPRPKQAFGNDLLSPLTTWWNQRTQTEKIIISLAGITSIILITATVVRQPA